MRCLLLLLLMAILSLLAALFVRRKSGREVATENNFRIQLMDSAITKKPSKRESKKEEGQKVLMMYLHPKRIRDTSGNHATASLSYTVY